VIPRTVDQVVERAVVHGLTFQRLDYGVAVACPICDNGRQDVILTVDGGSITGRCHGCSELADVILRALGDEPRVAGSTRRLRLRPLSSITRRQHVMLLPGWSVPIGTATVLAGQQGVGKGTILARVAAVLSRDGFGVIFLSEEDSAEAVIKPRIQAADGDVERVYLVEAARRDDLGGVLLPRDTDELGELAASVNARLIVIDPWTNHVNALEVDRGSMRQALMPLRYIAEQNTLVVALAAHPVKNAGRGHPLDEIAHASAVSQIARSGYWVTLDPEHGANANENPYRLVAHIKHNLTRQGDTLRYRLDEVTLPAGNGEPEMQIVTAREDGTSMLDYVGIRRREQSLNRAPNDDTKIANCVDWLTDYLADGEPQESGVVIAAGEAAGWQKRTIERARAVAGVTTHRGRVGTPSTWRLTSRHPVAAHENVGATGATGATQEEKEENGLPAREDTAPVAPVAPPDLHGAKGGATREPALLDAIDELVQRGVAEWVEGDEAHLQETTAPTEPFAEHQYTVWEMTGQVDPYAHLSREAEE
jgi:hypothetical protein